MSRTIIHIEPWSIGITDKSPVRLFHLPLTVRAGAHGRVFGFVEAQNRETAAALFTLIQEAAANLPPARQGATLGDRLGALLGSVNRRTIEARAAGTVTFEPASVTLLVAGSYKNEVAFSARGRIHALYLPAAKANLEPQDLFDRGVASPPAPLDAHRLLPSLISGGLGNADALVFAPARFLDFVSPKHLHALLAKKDTDPRAEILKTIADLGERTALFGIVLRAKPETAPRLVNASLTPHDSVEELIAKSRATEKIMSPTVFTALAGWAALTTQGAMSFGRRIKTLPLPTPGRFFRPAVFRMRALPRNAKFALAGALAFLILFLAGTFVYTGRGGGHKARRIIAAAQKNLDAAEAALLYGEEDHAWDIITAAKNLLQELPKSRSAISAAAPVKKSVDEFIRGLRKEIIIADPSLLGDLRTVTPDAKGTHLIAGEGGTLFVTDEATRVLVPFSPERRRFGDPIPLGNTGSLVDAVNYKAAPLVVTARRVAVTVTREGAVGIPLPLSYPAPTAAEVWNNRLYVLDADAGTVSRYQFRPGGFASGTLAQSASAALRTGLSLAIDGAIYVGTADGKILKFLGGRQQNFSLGRTDPPLGSVAALEVTAERPFLAVLVPATNRLVILNKTNGKVVAQYTSPKFDALKDFAIDEEKKHIYLLNGPQIFAIPAAHLEK